MMHARLAVAVAVIGVLAGCQNTPRQVSRNRASPAVVAACRAETDRVYAAQNRAELSYRDQRDTPFAGSYNSGITSRGLGARFGRDNMEASCLSANGGAGAVDPGIGPVFSPAAPNVSTAGSPR